MKQPKQEIEVTKQGIEYIEKHKEKMKPSWVSKRKVRLPLEAIQEVKDLNMVFGEISEGIKRMLETNNSEQ